MPEIPPEAIDAAAGVLWRDVPGSSRDLARTYAQAALEAAAPILAETVAQKITEHMENFGPRKPRGPLETSLNGIGGAHRTWCRYFGIAARIAAGAFDTREDQLRMTAEAIKRGDFIACDIPETPAEPKLTSEPVAEDEPWWCDCPDRKGPHVHMPNWSGQGSSIALTALADTGTGLEIPGSRKAGGG